MTQAALKIPSADWLEQDLKTAEGQKNILDELRRVTAIDSQERCHVQPTPHASGSRNPDTIAGAVFMVFIVLLAVAGYVVYKRNTTGYNILGGGGEHKFQVRRVDERFQHELASNTNALLTRIRFLHEHASYTNTLLTRTRF